MARRPRTIPGELLETFQSLLIAGRWLLVAAETIVTLLLLLTEHPGQRALVGLPLLFVYNLTSLVIVHRVPISRQPVIGLLSLALLFVAAVADDTGGSQSPFLWQCLLIIFAGALFYGLAGGVAAGALSVLITSLLVIRNPAGVWEDVRDLAPYFLITGPEEWPFEVGDTLVLYSDGLIETRNAHGEEFDLFRAASVLDQHAYENAQEILDALMRTVNRWGTPADDLTILVCRRVAVG